MLSKCNPHPHSDVVPKLINCTRHNPDPYVSLSLINRLNDALCPTNGNPRSGNGKEVAYFSETILATSGC
ncbi:hypothetical protein J6590_032323 [Homalodisca vitripennis]|nr:hypothetical protein J6590_032323 [Homalodisca vitripennis]